MRPEPSPETPIAAEGSAPAKVILCGEHAVVYGQPAIAVPVSGLRVTARVDPSDIKGSGIRLAGGDIERSLLVGPSPALHTLQAAGDALALIVHLVLARLLQPAPDANLTIHSQIPVASGLGSGAAVSTAVARALSAALRQPLDNATLNDIVYEVEKIHHGTPSGIDNTVIVYEQPVYFVRGLPIETFAIGAPFTLLIADTGQGALTRIAVGDVRRLYDSEPGRIQPVLNIIGALVAQTRQAIERGDLPALGQLMNQNHVYLQQLTVSSPELDALVQAALDAGALGAKLSGGGRGGNMIALVTPHSKPAVQAALLAAGAKRIVETTVV